MLLQTTKKFFKKTFRIFTSFFSDTTYHRLPKTPSPFTDNAQNQTSSSIKHQNNSHALDFSNKMHQTPATHQRKMPENNWDSRRLIAQLRELEKLDTSNVDHALDIEEILHYYSRLTCPAYVEIVDKFFAQILAEFSASSSPTCTVKFRPPESSSAEKYHFF